MTIRQFLYLIAIMIPLASCIHTPKTDKGAKVHSVKAGESLRSIADQYKLPWRFVWAFNQLTNPNYLKKGQVLKIPSGSHLKSMINIKAWESQNLHGWPLMGRISSYYGNSEGRRHDGIDIRAPKGTEVVASSPGKVIFHGWKRGYGRTIVIRHNQVSSWYAHLSKIMVSKNQQVGQGQVIGRVGTSGNATGSHLHFEMRIGEQPINPLSLMTSRSSLRSSL